MKDKSRYAGGFCHIQDAKGKVKVLLDAAQNTDCGYREISAFQDICLDVFPRIMEDLDRGMEDLAKQFDVDIPQG
jgi:hypothetical protein